jgi:hypothetical protein
MVLSQQNYHASMYNVVYKIMLSFNRISVPTFTLHLKNFCLKNSHITTRGVSPNTN